MFNRNNNRFAFGFEGGNRDWEGWTPPWMRDDEHGHGPHGPHFFKMRMRRGFFGPGGPFGPEGPFKEGRRFFGRGDVKYALLELLQERPMHGYEMMKALEERSGGFYAPSAGTIYPTLQLLEDRSLVTVLEEGGKKIYSITEAGRTFLNERQKEDEEEFVPRWARGNGPGRFWNEPEIQAIRTEAMEVARLFAIAGRASFRNSQKLAQLRTILERTHKDLTSFIYESDKQQAEGAPGATKETTPPAE